MLFLDDAFGIPCVLTLGGCQRGWVWERLKRDPSFRVEVRELSSRTFSFGDGFDLVWAAVLLLASGWLNRFVFSCRCGYTIEVEPHDDPTTSTGCCPGCGEKGWQMCDRDGNVVG